MKLVSLGVEQEGTPEKPASVVPRIDQELNSVANKARKTAMIKEESPSSCQVLKRATTTKLASFTEAVTRVEEEQAHKSSWFQLSEIKDDNFLEEWETLDLLLSEEEEEGFDFSKLNPYANEIDLENGIPTDLEEVREAHNRERKGMSERR